jgi:hypothetical protein
MEEVKAFDLTVSHRDPKSHKTIKITDYTRHTHKLSGESHTIYERASKFFHENGIPVKDEENFVLHPEKFSSALTPVQTASSKR